MCDRELPGSGAIDRNCLTENVTFRADVSIATEDSKLADLAEDTQRVKGIGEIVIKVFRKREPVRKPYANSQSSARGDDMEAVHEKALKGEAKSHSVS